MYGGSNPSALRSQRLLAIALIELMAEHAFSEITVSMLSNRAGVSRQTFYKMFDSKEDIVRYVAKSKCLDFELQMAKRESMTLEELAKCTFSFFGDNILLVRQLIDNQLQHLLQEQAQLALVDLLTCFRCTDNVAFDSSNRVFIAGGLCAMLVSWAEQDDEISPEVQASRFAKLFAVTSFTRTEPARRSVERLIHSYRT